MGEQPTSSMNVIVSHIFRDKNHYTDKLANIGLSIPSFFWWEDCPIQVRNDYVHNMLGLPSFGFS
jgi:hypothetical protein